VLLTEAGHEHTEQLLARVDLCPTDAACMTFFINLMHRLMRLCGRTTCSYATRHVVREGEVIIVDEFTGRLMSGRRGQAACTRRSRRRSTCRSRTKPDLATITRTISRYRSSPA
jgi:preprotein translocase subunit SecA